MQQFGILWKRNELLPSVHCPSIWTHTSQDANIIKMIFTDKCSQSYSSSHGHYTLHNVCLSLRKWYQLFGSFTQWKSPSTITDFILSNRKGPYLGRRVPRLQFHCTTTLLHISRVVPSPSSRCHVPCDRFFDPYAYSTELWVVLSLTTIKCF